MTALIGFFVFSSARHFLGDGYVLLGKLDAEYWHDKNRAPLTYALIGTLHSLGSVLWETAENTYRLYSYISGTLYVLLSFPIAAALGKNGLERSIFLAFLLTAGFVQQFFGYVENYALYLPGLLLYLFLGQRTFEDRLSLAVPALLLGMLVAFHRVLAFMGPSLLYLAYRDFRRRHGRIPSWKNTLATTAGLCCLPLSAAFFLALSGVGFEAYTQLPRDGEFLPLFEQPGYNAQYRIFSFQHLLDFVNLQLLSAPAACMAIFLVRTIHPGSQAFLTISAAIPLFFTFLAKPNLGAFRDWDVLSLAALPLTLWMSIAFVERIRSREQLIHGAVLICGSAALHTFLWIGVNASAEPAEARFTSQLARLTGHASNVGWSEYGGFYQRQDNPSAALPALKRALDADPTHFNKWILVGNIHWRMGQTPEAITHYQKAAELRPDRATPFMNLGVAYSDLGQFEKAIEYALKATELQPDLATAHTKLGELYGRTGKFDKALEHLEKALQLQGEKANAKTYVRIGGTYYDMREHEKAIPYLKRAIQLNPKYANAHLLLGMTYLSLKRSDRARFHFEKTLELQPNHPRADPIKQWLRRTGE